MGAATVAAEAGAEAAAAGTWLLVDTAAPQSAISTFFDGCPLALPHSPASRTISIPSITLPNAAYFPSRWGQGARQMKSWAIWVLGLPRLNWLRMPEEREGSAYLSVSARVVLTARVPRSQPHCPQWLDRQSVWCQLWVWPCVVVPINHNHMPLCRLSIHLLLCPQVALHKPYLQLAIKLPHPDSDLRPCCPHTMQQCRAERSVLNKT